MKNKLERLFLIQYFFIIISVLCLLMPCASFSKTQTISTQPQATKTGSIRIVMVGIKNNIGMMRIGLFNTSEAYSDMKRPAAPLAFRKGSAKIHQQQSAITFTKVPYGVYAVKLYQDEFMTGRLKRNVMGKPLEGVGISNNPKIKTRLPAWDQAKFVLDKPSVTLVIQMQNF